MTLHLPRILSWLTVGTWAALSGAVPARAAVPSTQLSYYVPQAGAVETPVEGASARRLFRFCPNNDGGSSLPNHARIKVVVRMASGDGIGGIAADDIGILFNGGTPGQGFSGIGADSIVANSQFNGAPLCPDVRFVTADGPTDMNGTTSITFTGSSSALPGVGVRNPNRKWGHSDSELPLYVLGFKLSGRLTTESTNETYTLRIKNFDWTGGTGADANQGETVTVTDFNGVANGIDIDNAISYWKDLDSSGRVTVTYLNMITGHLNHDCDSPNNP